jgi:hypothetical protein
MYKAIEINKSIYVSPPCITGKGEKAALYFGKLSGNRSPATGNGTKLAQNANN